MSKYLLIVCVLCSWLVASNLYAQQSEPEPSATQDASAQPERGRIFQGRGRFGQQGMGFVPLLQIDSVKQELKLEGDQAAQVDSLTVNIREDFAEEIRGMMQSFRDADPADRQQFRDRMAEMANRINERLGTVLNSEQTSRLRQINLQLGLRRDGAATALSSSDIAAALDLTAEQQKQLREQAQAQGGRGAVTLAEAREEANALLSPDQQEKLVTLLGAEFDLPAAMLEGNRGRGGFGGRRGNTEGRRSLRQRPEMAEETEPAEAI